MLREDQVIRSNRKSISLSIQKDGSLLIRAPYSVPLADIDAFVAKKQRWIAEKQALQKKAHSRADDISFAPGSRIPFLGGMLILDYHKQNTIHLENPSALNEQSRNFRGSFPDFSDCRLLLPHPCMRTKDIQLAAPDEEQTLAQNRNALFAWYKEQAKTVLSARTDHYSAVMGLICERIRISSAHGNWGSCNAHRGINYTRMLVSLSLYEIDYVVVHELTHILHRDHSSAFYRDVEKILPDYREREKAIDGDQWVIEIFS